MSKTISWPNRVIYILIALALALSLAAVAVAVPKTDADPGTTKWTKVTTPSETDQTIEPGSNLYDFAVGPDGKTVYVIGETWDDKDDDDVLDAGEIVPALWKSTDGGATWSDKTDKLLKKNVKLDLPAEFAVLTQVAVAPDDKDFVVVAGTLADGKAAVVGSTDGATKFYYTGDMTLGTTINPGRILCLDVSRKVDVTHDIGVGTNTGYVLRYEAGGYWGAHWVNATATATYPGWVASTAVTSLTFSPSWSADKTVLVISTDGSKTWLQTGAWGTRKGWGTVVERASAVQFKVDTIAIAPIAIFPGVTGMALPSDYNGYESSLRRVYAYVDTENLAPNPNGGYLFRIDSTTLSPACGPTGNPWLASIAYYGTHDAGDAMLGMLAEGAPTTLTPTNPCAGIEVYRTAEIDVCCPQWTGATKKPSGQAYAMVAFTPDGKKAYAITQDEGLAGESAFSVSLDKGKCWNQLGLIDTDIDYISDVAVSLDCSVTYLSSVNGKETNEVCGCDSVWMKDANATEYAGVWQRVYHKALTGADEIGLLRLSPEHDAGDVVYWGDFGTTNLYWADNKGICKWSARSTTLAIQDFALADDDTIYVINNGDDIAKWTKAKLDWTSAVSHKAVKGHTIAVLGDYVLVGGDNGSVSYSKDSAASFSRLGDKGVLTGKVHVALDSKFTDNKTVYAAVTGGKQGIWRWVVDTSTSWKDLEAKPTLNQMGGIGAAKLDVSYYGIVLGKSDGTLYAAYTYEDDGDWYTGVARCLTPAAEVCCGALVWDYLHAGLKVAADQAAAQQFNLEVSSLRICGCLTAASNSKLFAIDNDPYKMADGKDGTLWTYEDCVAKVAPKLTAVADGATVAADPCVCFADVFTLTWDRLCNACEYDIQVALDKGFTKIVADTGTFAVGSRKGTGGFYSPPKPETPSLTVPKTTLACATTFYWRVRVRYSETDEAIRSPWSAPWSFTVAAGPAAAIELNAPENGATNVAITTVGFSWKTVQYATGYDFVLSKNADLSSPVDSKTGITGTAYTCTKTLENSTAYYWQVTANKDTSVLSKSSISTFTTVSAKVFTCPQCGLTFPSEAALKTHIAEAHPAPPSPVTPAWVWVVIGLGAVLVIVVIVLIFRTRRV